MVKNVVVKIADDVNREPPNTLLLGERLRAERERLGLSIDDATLLLSRPKKTIVDWEEVSSNDFANALRMLALAGADVCFIVTGIRNKPQKADGSTAEDRFNRALAELPAYERWRVLLYFVARELKYSMSKGI